MASASSFPSVPSSFFTLGRLGLPASFKLWVLVAVVLLCVHRCYGGLDQPPTLPTRDQCLYFSDNNGYAEVLQFNQSQGALVVAALAISNSTNLIDQVTYFTLS